MIVKDYQNGKMIILSKPFDTRAKILNSIYFFVFTVCAIAFGVNFVLSIIIIVVFAAYVNAGYKFLNKSLQSEKIIVDKNGLTIIRSGFLSTKRASYDNSLIANFRHLDKPEITKHPTAGQTFDYLGFQTEQAVINEMHGDNRLAFNYNGNTITFGENVYTWDFEELEVLLYDITGNDFRYTDDFEASFNLTDEG